MSRLTLQDLHAHARRFGVEGVWDVALQEGYSAESLLSFAESLAQLDAERARKERAARGRRQIDPPWSLRPAERAQLGERKASAPTPRQTPPQAAGSRVPGGSSPGHLSNRGEYVLMAKRQDPGPQSGAETLQGGFVKAGTWRRTTAHKHSSYACGDCGQPLRSPHEFYRHHDRQHAP